MKTLLITFLLVFLVASMAAPTLGAGWFWDFGNAFGFVAFAGGPHGPTRRCIECHRSDDRP